MNNVGDPRLSSHPSGPRPIHLLSISSCHIYSRLAPRTCRKLKAPRTGEEMTQPRVLALRMLKLAFAVSLITGCASGDGPKPTEVLRTFTSVTTKEQPLCKAMLD